MYSCSSFFTKEVFWGLCIRCFYSNHYYIVVGFLPVSQKELHIERKINSLSTSRGKKRLHIQLLELKVFVFLPLRSRTAMLDEEDSDEDRRGSRVAANPNDLRHNLSKKRSKEETFDARYSSLYSALASDY